MDVYLTRADIRQRVLDLTGYSTNAAVTGAALARLNRWIDMAATQVAEQSRWLSLRRRATIAIGTGGVTWGAIELARWLEQQYPTQYNPATYNTAADTWQPADLLSATLNNLGPGGLIEAAWWDDTGPVYRPLSIADTPAQYDTNRQAQYVREVELQSIAAGDDAATTASKVSAAQADMDAQTGEPVSVYKTAVGLALWPAPDATRVLRIVYDVSPEWQTGTTSVPASQLDGTYSVVDGLAIVYLTAVEQFALDGDDTLADRMAQKAATRLTVLRGRQATGEVVEIDPDITFRDFADTTRAPNWQRAR